ncbi:hypothetical protein CCP3SC15_1980002 [Gammaproteobacteria bacterium]
MAEQGVLLSEKKGLSQEMVSNEMVMARCKSLTSAIDYCIEASPYTRQQIAFQMGVDSGHLNRMLNPNDSMNFPPDRILELMAYCGNLIPLKFIALSARHGIHRLMSDVEEENERLKEQLKIRDHRESAIMDFLEKAKVNLNFGG